MITPSMLINDKRLTALFSDKSSSYCALQLWLLQTKKDSTTTTTLLYGRALPFNHSSHEWNIPKKDNFKSIDGTPAQILTLSLYCTPPTLKKVIEGLTSNKNISTITSELSINSNDKLEERVGDFRLPSKINSRPVTFLAMRESNYNEQMKSPHGAASAFSAALSPESRTTIFNLNTSFSPELTQFIIHRLNKDTGMRFEHQDSSRLGDLELLVFPTLGKFEQNLLLTEWNRETDQLTVKLDLNGIIPPTTVSLAIRFINDELVVHAELKTETAKSSTIEFTITPPSHVNEITDQLHFDIYVLNTEENTSQLYCSYDAHYLRANTILTRSSTVSGNKIQLDWLTNTTKISPKDKRITAIQSVSQGSRATVTTYNNNPSDPWVSINRKIRSLVKEVFPAPSEGQFFQRFRDGTGEGRLELSEWITKIFGQYQEHQIIIFDPYFEDAGVSLLLPKSSTGSEYIVLTMFEAGKSEERIDKIKQCYDQIAKITQPVKFRLYGFPKDFLHDRYILIYESGEAIKGYHLSNSLQNANTRHPLLVTPIPIDTLYKVSEYVHEILRDPSCYSAPQTAPLLFDSEDRKKNNTIQAKYEPLSFLCTPSAGLSISAWTGNNIFSNLTNESLLETLTRLGYTTEETINISKFNSPKLFFAFMATTEDSKFSELWEVGANILAHTPAGEKYRNLSSPTNLTNKLKSHLQRQADKAPPSESEDLQESYTCSYLNTPIESLILHARNYDFSRTMKNRALGWGDYYAIKILWYKSPDLLLDLIEEFSHKLTGSKSRHYNALLMRSICTQALSEISLSCAIGILNVTRIKKLISRDTALLRWFGYTGLNSVISEKPIHLSIANRIKQSEQKLIIGWLVSTNSFRKDTEPHSFEKSVELLLSKYPTALSTIQTREIINNLRGHMHQLSYSYPWLIENILNPLIESDRISYNDASKVWQDEVMSLINERADGKTSLFSIKHQGETTDYAASLYAKCTLEYQTQSLEILTSKLEELNKKIQKPLASTNNWTSWDNNLKACFWIYGYLKWTEYYLPHDSLFSNKLDIAIKRAWEISSRRSLDEWKKQDYTGGEFSIFLQDRDPPME
ncbi:VPA1262 family protein [Pseudomonas helvetica]|uniref:VPA1262 family protein n=1 Tax=Pseudomonas helvetica TaxID=3136738 RepID=UPI003266531D